MKNLPLMLTAASLALALNAGAGVSGSLQFVQSTLPSTFTTSSLQFGGNAYISLTSGAFSGLGVDYSTMTTSTSLLGGLSDVAQVENISDFLVFSSGTSPVDRFHFDLSDMAEYVYKGTDGQVNMLYFYGQGTLRDLGGEFAPSPASIGFSVVVQNGTPTSAFNGNLNATLEQVPEPSIAAFACFGLGLLLCRGRKA